MNLKKLLSASVDAAKAAGALMRKNLNVTKKVNAKTSHDIKLELDVRCQKLIEKKLHAAFPEIAVLGEEGNTGAEDAAYRWVIDPIDGTVNFSYGIPHACVCIALQKKESEARSQKSGKSRSAGNYETILGVICDPFQDELWSATTTDKARLNGKPIHVSTRAKLEDCICVMGYGKDEKMIRETLPLVANLTIKCRKLRNMGSAGLGLVYVACGRFDAYIERGVSLWDIAAGGFILERAGGEFWRVPIDDKHGYRMIVSNGRLRKKIEALM
ncbi:MAG TPA: inositol monophosphatase family protein [Candidatus Paceibacterota bacterium]|nr:inositol monophosphatase family protein [Candidatus Paceibacterota bacterium]